MITALRRYWGDTFWRNNAIFLAGSLLVALINYLYYPLLGRVMDVTGFGEILVLISILNLVGMLLAAFQIVAVNIAANGKKETAAVIQELERLMLLFIALIFLLMVIFAARLQQFFNFTSPAPFTVLGIVLCLNVVTAFCAAYVQGRSNFVAVSINGAIAALGKIIFSVGLVVFGLGTFGAIAGILMASTVSFGYMTYAARRGGYVSTVWKKPALPDLKRLKPLLLYLVSVMAVFDIVTLMYTGDVFVVKRYFSPEAAGQYAGVSAIAKVIFFATASFAGVLLASVGQAYATEHNRKVLRKSLLLVATVGGAALLLFASAPEFIITSMIGERYAGSAYLLPLLSLVVFGVAIMNLYVYYFLAMRQYVIVPITLSGGVVTAILSVLRHGTLEHVIQNFLLGSLLVLGMIAGLRLYDRMKTGGASA